MKLSEIFTQLTVGELSQLSIGSSVDGKIPETSYPKLIPHVNLALTALYKRFPLKEGVVMVNLQSNMTNYPLNVNYAVSNRRSRETTRFIMDSTAEPFIEDVLKIERVYTDSGKELGLNDESNPYSLFTPTATTLRVPASIVAGDISLPDGVKTTHLKVVYRANHPQIVMGLAGFEPERVEIELPYSHLEPLLFYIASRMHNPIGMTTEFNMGNNFAAKYENSCLELEMKNLRIDQGSQNTRLERNGWV